MPGSNDHATSQRRSRHGCVRTSYSELSAHGLALPLSKRCSQRAMEVVVRGALFFFSRPWPRLNKQVDVPAFPSAANLPQQTFFSGGRPDADWLPCGGSCRGSFRALEPKPLALAGPPPISPSRLFAHASPPPRRDKCSFTGHFGPGVMGRPGLLGCCSFRIMIWYEVMPRVGILEKTGMWLSAATTTGS